LRPSQLVEDEETVEDIKNQPRKRRRRRKKELFFCLLRLINSAELIRCQSCWDFGRFVRRIFGEKTTKKGEKKKTGTDDKDGRVLSCASLWLFSVKTTLWASEWAVNLVNNTHTTRPNPVSQ
jgi:hypothetical protein